MYFELLYSTGMRVSECVQLNINDINLSEQECLIKGKGNKERIGLFGESVQLLLDDYIHKNSTFMVKKQRSRPIFITERNPTNIPKYTTET